VANKINLGMPLYGLSFNDTTQPGDRFNGVGPSQRHDPEPGLWDYKLLPQPGATQSTDASVMGSYSYDAGKRIVTVYDTQLVVRLKALYIESKGLGGAMFFESSQDKQGDDSLITTVRQMSFLYLL
jgi:chitinase